MTALVLREANADDADRLYSWRNEAAVRENSFNTEVVGLETHRRWLDAKLGARRETRIWILIEDAVPVGQVRYDKRGAVAEISFSIDSRFRGRGLGAAILRMSAPRACHELTVREVRGLVKPHNIASIRAFERAGFRRAPDQDALDDDGAVIFGWRDDY